MKALEWLLLAVYFALASFASVPVNTLTLMVLCIVLFSLRIAQGERLSSPPPS